MRASFSDALVRLATEDSNVVLLTGDHGYALFDDFRKNCPGQYINAGIAEQNMVGMAAGLARTGHRPIVYGLSSFVPIRVLEQIKLDIAHDNLPVILVGDGAGFVYSHLGTSHQSTEDIACVRAIPGLHVLSPADRFEMTMCMDLAYGASAPVYLRMGKSDRGDVHKGVPQLVLGGMIKVRPGKVGELALLATGSMVRTAVDIAITHLPNAEVWSVPSLKPLDGPAVEALSRSACAIVTLEEHSVIGGLGSALAELCAARAPKPLLRIGVQDVFSEHCGSYDYLLHEHGLDTAAVLQKINAFRATL